MAEVNFETPKIEFTVPQPEKAADQSHLKLYVAAMLEDMNKRCVEH